MYDYSNEISIHAPRKAERRYTVAGSPFLQGFQSTLRARRSDVVVGVAIELIGISIHAPRKAERPLFRKRYAVTKDFNPRSAQGGATRAWWCRSCRAGGFQSTLRARRSDKVNVVQTRGESTISIHAPRKAERRQNPLHLATAILFQSTLRARRSDTGVRTAFVCIKVFQSTLRARRSDLVRS